jgi:biotin-dependent carboxylase-like uncharacterized protein
MTALRVVRLDCQVLIEDLGRPGWAHLGVPPSGALDQESLALANRLVGNRESQAGLEILLGGVALVAEGSVRLALTGGQLPMRAGGRAVGWGVAVSVSDGCTIEVGRAPDALRGWLAVAGGVAVPPVLGSRSTDTLSGLGPQPVRAGDRIPVGRSRALRAGDAAAVPRWSATDGGVMLRVHPGPRDDWFTAQSLAGLWSASYRVSPSSDRIALRLDGAPLVRRWSGELPSEGLVTGAVQVPGDGQPLIFLADRPTTGGYPVVGVVAAADLPRCAQLRPGDSIRFARDRQPPRTSPGDLPAAPEAPARDDTR